LSERVEAFCEDLINTILPDKCGGDSPGDGDEPPLESEFTRAVEELAKSKLEKPKTLGEVMNKYWNEVSWDILQFERQELEVSRRMEGWMGDAY
jgi:insulysin